MSTRHQEQAAALNPKVEVTVALHGRLTDTRAQVAAARIRAALNNGVRRVVLDCAQDLEFCSGEFLGFLMIAAQRLGARDGSGVIWKNTPAHLKQLLAALRADCCFSYEESGEPQQ